LTNEVSKPFFNTVKKAVKKRTVACITGRIEQIAAALLRSEEALKQRDATIAANNAESQCLNRSIKEREKSISDTQAQLAEAEREHERKIAYQQARDSES